MEILDTFCDDGYDKISRMKEALSSGNLPTYTTYIHALKSACANIGADEIAEAAQKLEAAGEKRDLDYIEALSGRFLEKLSTLLDNIRRALYAHAIAMGNEAEQLEPLSGEAFLSDLAKLKEALQSLNANTINSVAAGLHKLVRLEEDFHAVRRISRSILLAEYDEAIGYIDEILHR